MKSWKIAAALVFCSVAAAGAQTTPPPPPAAPPAPAAAPAAPAAPAVASVDPAGTYEFSTVVNGETVTGTLYVTPVATGGYNGRLVTSTFPEMAVTGASSTGNAVDVKATMPDGNELALHFVMNGAEFKGGWAVGSDSGDFNGKKLPPAPPAPPKQ